MEEIKVRVSVDQWSAMALNHKLKKIRRNIDAATASIEKCEAKIESARSALTELTDSELAMNVDQSPSQRRRFSFGGKQ